MRWPGNRCQRILFCGDVHRVEDSDDADKVRQIE